MAPRTKEQFSMIREERRKQIMDAALEVFARDGFHSASISQIALHAGISKGLLYNYFESKENLLFQILVLGVEQIHDILKRIENELDTPEELMIFIKGGFELMKAQPDFYKLYFSVIFQKEVTDLVRTKYREVFGPLLEDIAIYFKVKGDPYPYEKAMLLGATIDGMGMHYLIAPEMVDLEKMEKIIFELFR